MKNALMRSEAGVDKRCSWVNLNDPLLLEYHDREWGVPVHSDRRDDIPLLVHYFANKYARRMGKQIESIPNETMDALSRYSWPGNIRELQNLMERAALLSTGPSLRVPLAEILNDPAFSGGNALEQAEREQILRALRETNWVVGGARGAAARLGLKRTSLAYKMDKLGIWSWLWGTAEPNTNSASDCASNSSMAFEVVNATSSPPCSSLGTRTEPLPTAVQRTVCPAGG
jgi:hypothetical protein